MAFVDWHYANGISSLMISFPLGSSDPSYVVDSCHIVTHPSRSPLPSGVNGGERRWIENLIFEMLSFL